MIDGGPAQLDVSVRQQGVHVVVPHFSACPPAEAVANSRSGPRREYRPRADVKISQLTRQRFRNFVRQNTDARGQHDGSLIGRWFGRLVNLLQRKPGTDGNKSPPAATADLLPQGTKSTPYEERRAMVEELPRARQAFNGGEAAMADLVAAIRSGRVSVANAIGNGVADDKLIYSYVPDLTRHYLDEDPILPNVDTYRLNEPDALAHVLDRLDEMVVKPVDGSGGKGLVVGPAASRRELDELRTRLQQDPRGWIAQPVVQLSTIPTLVDDGLQPRHADLRPFAVHDGDDVWVLPGGLTRVALPAGQLVVNSSQGGGSKDTWIVGGDVAAWAGHDVSALIAEQTTPTQSIPVITPEAAAAAAAAAADHTPDHAPQDDPRNDQQAQQQQEHVQQQQQQQQHRQRHRQRPNDDRATTERESC